MPQTIFTEHFHNSLKASIQSNLDRYKDAEPWVHELPNAAKGFLETPLVPSAPLEFVDPTAESKKDFENAKRIFQAFPNLTPTEARDSRLWSKLCHVEFWDYMRKRWPVENYKDDDGQRVRNMAKHYFVSRGDSRGVLENGIAGLWWFAKLTYDKTRENPYELTGVLLSKLDIAQQILERNLGRAPSVLTGFLEFLLMNKDELLIDGNKARHKIRVLAKILNLSGGVCLLDSLSKGEVMAALNTELKRIQAEPAASE